MRIKYFWDNFYKYFLIKLINYFNLINNLFLFFNTITLGYFRYYWYLFSKKFYFILVDVCFVNCIESEIKKLTKFLHPLDIFSLYIDTKKNIGGPEGLVQKFGNKSFEVNIREIFDIENITYMKKKYPAFFEKLFFILLVKNDKGIDIIPHDRVDGRLGKYVAFKVQEIYSLMEWLLLRKIFEGLGILMKWDVLGGRMGIYNYFEYKLKFNCLIHNKKFKEVNEYKILFDLLANYYVRMNILDMEYDYDDYRAFERLKFLIKFNLIGEKYKEWYDNIYSLFYRLNSSLLNHSFLVSDKLLEQDKEIQFVYRFIQEIGVISYSEFKKNLKEYLGKKGNVGIVKSLLYSEFIKYPGIIEFHNEKFKNLKGFFILPKGFFTYMWRKVRDSINPGNFGKIIEKYAYLYLKELLTKGKLDESLYLIEKGVLLKSKKKNLGDIDLLIYNKKTKSIVIFEFKYINVLINFKKEIKDLISKDGELKKVISQLKKIHTNLEVLERKLKIKIDRSKVHYVTVNFGKSKLWNSIIRDFVEFSDTSINIFDDFIYTFMNMYEFEDFVYIATRLGFDFFDILDWKSKVSIGPPFFKFLFSKYSLEPKIFNNLPEFLSTSKYISYIEDDMDIYLKVFKRKINFKTPFDL